MGVIRIGHVKIRVLEMEPALAHYRDVLGMYHTHTDGSGDTYLKAWDEWDLYSVILTESDRAGLDHVAFKVASDADLDQYRGCIVDHGTAVTQLEPGAIHGMGRGLRFTIPNGLDMVLFADKEFHGTEVGSLNPDPWPDGLRGCAVRWLDHCLLMGELDPEAGVNTVADSCAFMMDVLDFRLTEQVVAGPDQDVQIAAFLTTTTKPHDIAFVGAPTSGFHHAGFFLESWEEVLKAADVLAKNRVRVDVTPQRHGITRGYTTYFWDPSGNRNETFGGMGYLASADRPTVTWTEDQLGSGVFYHTGTTIPTFVEIYT
jgi:catechol 2,3-dioxygenase